MASNRKKRKDFLFVYGTLRKGAAHNEILSRYGEPVSSALLQAKLYDLGKYPAAVISENPADVVVGELYALDPKYCHEALDALDRYEGIDDGTPTEYRRERHVVTLEDGTRMKAWVYLYSQDPRNGRYIPSGDYLAHVKSRVLSESKK